MQSNLFTVISAIILTVILFGIQYLSLQPPDLKPINAPTNEFSGERAYNILKRLLAENKPHPVGSIQNKIVKQRIIDELDRLDIQVSEQNTWACATRSNNCAFVENIIAVIPGKSDRPYITLMSHYDSVPMAPGAGDDGAAVAAMLETARILKSEAPFEHPILFLFTDAEEMGLIGAEGFYGQHPLAEKIAVVLDFEGSGSTGISMVLRTSLQNEYLMDVLQSSDKPLGFSFASEIFKRMPNDTDFSVVERANLPGIDFAFAGERNHYHTPNDNLRNIDLRTIQHHGENMLPLARKLASSDTLVLGSHHLFASIYGTWVQWDERFSVFLLLASFTLLCFGFVKLRASVRGTALATLSSLLVVLLTVLVCFLTFEFIKLGQGTVVAWPANDAPYLIALFAAALTGGLIGISLNNRYLNPVDTLLGVWCFWLLLTSSMVIYLPDAANTLLVPTLAASLIIAISVLLNDKARKYWLVLNLVFALPATIGFVPFLVESQGYKLIAGTFIFLGLYMSALMPLLQGTRLLFPFLGSLAITVAAIGVTISNPLYSEWRPQHLNIHYFEDMDTGDAYYQLQSPNPAPTAMLSLMEFEIGSTALLPYSRREFANWAPAERSAYPAPEIDIQGLSSTGDKQTIRAILRSPRHADTISLIFPAESALSKFRIEGIPFRAIQLDTGNLKGQYRIRIMNIYDRQIQIELEFKSLEPITLYLADKSTQLPDTARELLQKRPPFASPVHQGDQALLFRKIILKK